MTNKRSISTLVVLGAVVLFLIIIGGGNRWSFFGNLARQALSPFTNIAHNLGEVFHLNNDSSLSSAELQQKLNTLESANQSLGAENARLLTLEDENKHLRDYLNFKQTKKVSLQMAEVVARGLAEDSWHNREVITLNQGFDQGVSVGLPIVSSEGVLIGKITSVKGNISEACLLYSSDCRLAVSLAGQGATIGIAHGDLGISILIEFIPQSQVLSEGQIITTSGLENGMPAGLLIGHVSKVIKQSNELWQSAVLEPATDFDNLRFVAILK
jgi:rod shape-determining protein MreC